MSGEVGFVATNAIAAPAVSSVPAVAMRSIEKNRFRLNAGAVLIFIRVGFCGLMNFEALRLRSCNHRIKLFYGIFLLGYLSWNEPERGEELGAGIHCSPGTGLRRSGTKVAAARSTGLRPSTSMRPR